jgi:hypothetical protein
MLLLGAMVAATMVAQGTSAYFTTSTSVASNAFTLTQINFTAQTNGGTSCTASPGTGVEPATGCGTVMSLTNMVPGDRVYGRIKLTNATGSDKANVAVWLKVQAESGGSSLLDTTARASGGAGLLMFRCYKGSSASPPSLLSVVADCSSPPGSGQALYLLPVYPAASGSPCGALSGALATDWDGTSRNTFKLPSNTPLSVANFTTSPTASNTTITLSGSSTVTCTGGNLAMGSYQPVGGPSTITGVTNTGSAQSRGILGGLTGGSDYLAAVAYLPTSAPTSMQDLTTSVEFRFIAEQSTGP